MPPAAPAPVPQTLEFSLVRGDPAWRLLRWLRLVSPQDLGLRRRFLASVLMCWAPLVVWELLRGGQGGGQEPEPLLRHFAVHVRFLVAVPALLLAEMIVDRIGRLVPHIANSGLVTQADQPRLHALLERASGRRDSFLAYAAMVAAVVVLAWMNLREAAGSDGLSWAVVADADGAHLSFGGYWYVCVARSFFLFLMLQWVWRLCVGTGILLGISRLDLQLVPTHPDRMGGLGFLEEIPIAASPIAVAISAVIAGHWGHNVLYHQVDVASLRVPLAVLLTAMVVLFLAPLLFFSRNLRLLKRHGLLQYGALVARHGRLVHRRWIHGEAVEDAGLLDAPEIGPVADTLSLYEAVAQLRTLPISKRAILAIAAATLLPMLPVLAIEVPLREILIKLFKALA